MKPHHLFNQRHDIQGVLLWGYSRLKHAYYVPLAVVDPPKARDWLGSLDIQSAGLKPDKSAQSVAFTAAGIRALWPDSTAVGELLDKRFGEAFAGGMTSRARALGDVGESAPENWLWRDVGESPPDPEYDPETVHILLMLFSHEPDRRDWNDYLKTTGTRLARGQVLESSHLPWNGKNREHFGFVDGLAQPILKGSLRQQPEPMDPGAMVAPGEFVLGFEDESGPGLRRTGELSNRLRWNGSFMVFRKLEQDVAAFWRFARSAASELEPVAAVDESEPFAPPSNAEDRRIWLGAKMVGRWPNGVPFALADRWQEAERYVHASNRELDGFSFAEEDPAGHMCPIGSHIRRANPRDSDVSSDRAEAQMLINRRRLIRRGRAYGPPVSDACAPRFEAVMELDDEAFEELLAEKAKSTDRGLIFVCFNADIERQFEFVQHSWLNNPHFAGLANDPDPVVGSANEQLQDPPEHCFSIPGTPMRTRVTGFRRYVTPRAGGYFFVPGLDALRMLLSDELPDLARRELEEAQLIAADSLPTSDS